MPDCSIHPFQYGIVIPTAHRIGNPLVDLRFVPASAMNADLDLARKTAVIDLPVKGRSGEASPVKDGCKSKNTVVFRHGLELHRMGR